MRPFQLLLLLLLANVRLSAQTELHYLSSTTGAASYSLEYIDGYLYSGEGNTLSVYAVPPGAEPPYDRIFQHRFTSVIDDLVLEGNDLFVAANKDGIYRWDVSEPANPSLEAFVILDEGDGNAAYDIAVAGDQLFVAGKRKIQAYQNNPDDIIPAGVAFQVTNDLSFIRGCALKDGLLAFTVCTWSFISTPMDGVYLYDAQTFDQLAFYPETFCDAEDVLFGQNTELLHVLGGGQFSSSFVIPDPRGHFYSLDISNPQNPELVYSDTIPGFSGLGDSQAIAAENRNDTIFVATRTGDDGIFPLDGNVFVYDATDANDIHFVNYIPAGLLHFDVTLQDDIAHIASEWFGIRSMDISDLNNPQFIGDTRTGGWNKTTDIFEDRMVQANEGYGFQVFDISNPKSPQLLGVHENVNNGFNYGIHFSHDGAHIYALYLSAFNWSEVRVFDANTLEQVGELDFYAGTEYTQVYENLLVTYAGLGGNYLSFVDVTDPTEPSLIETQNRQVNDMALHEAGYLFAATDEGLIVFDLNGGISEVFEEPGIWNNVAIFADQIYAYPEEGDLHVFSWDSQSQSASLTNTLDWEHGVPDHMAVGPLGLYLGYTTLGLFALDKDLLEPIDQYTRLGGEFVLPSVWPLQDLKVAGDLIFVVEYFGQTSIFSLNDAYLVGTDNPVQEPPRIQVFPNPAIAGQAIQFELSDGVAGTLNLFTHDGQKVFSRELKQKSYFGVSWEPPYPGVYFYHFLSENGDRASGKVIVPVF